MKYLFKPIKLIIFAINGIQFLLDSFYIEFEYEICFLHFCVYLINVVKLIYV